MDGTLRFLADETGAVTIEFVTLVPAFVLILVFFIDCSTVYLTRTQMWSVARDVARRMSTEQFTTSQQVRDYAAEHLNMGGRTYIIDPDFDSDMTVTIAVPLGDAAMFGAWLEPIAGNVLWARVTMRREPLIGPT